jgi:N-acetylneuraminic acid mutarotase
VDNQIYSVRGHADWEPSVIMYDLLAKQFYDMPSFPGGNWFAIEGVTFSIGGAGYAGLTFNSKELWRFKPSVSLAWERISDFPGKAMYEALALSNSKAAFIIGGKDTVSSSNETWGYDPLNDSWERRADYPGNGSNYLTGFVINDKLYVGSGMDAEGKSHKDFWEYDPATNYWIRVADFIGRRYLMYSFSLDNKGYSGAGFESVCDDCGGDKVFYDLWKFELQ